MSSITDTLAQGAKQYCEIKIVATAISSMCVAIALIVIAFMLPGWAKKTQNYVMIQGTVAAGTIVTRWTSKSTQYAMRLAVEYTVQGKKYTTNIETGSFTSESVGQARIAERIGKPETLYYNPNNPSQTVTALDNGQSKWISAGSVVCAILIVAWAGISIYLRNNPYFCGATIASNVVSSITD